MVLNFQKDFTDEIKTEYLIFCPKQNTVFNENVRRTGAVVHLFPDLGLINYFKIKKRLKELFQNTKFDIVHLHSPVLGFLCLKAAKKCGQSVRIVHYHSSVKAEKKSKLFRNAVLYRLGAEYATHFIGCSELAAESAPANTSVKVIYNGIDCRKFRYDSMTRKVVREKMKFEDKIVIGHVARLSYPKNQTFLLDIFEELYRMHDHCRLFIIGDGPLQNDLTEYIKGKEYEKAVIFGGRSSEIPKLLSAMDVFVLTSKYEGMPVSVLEAQASGLPCVLSSQITREVSALNSNVFISLEEEKSIWADEIWRMAVTDHGDRSCSYLAMIEKGFDITRASGVLESYYKEIIGGHKDAFS